MRAFVCCKYVTARKRGQYDRVGQQQRADAVATRNSFKSTIAFITDLYDVVIVANQNEESPASCREKIPSGSCRSSPCHSASGLNNERPFLKGVHHSFALINFYREQCLASIF